MKTLNELIDELFYSYARTENFVNLDEKTRNALVDQVEELKELASKLTDQRH